MIKLVVFDWNGTLFADTIHVFEADRHILKRHGGRPISMKEYKETIVIPAIDFYVHHGCDRERILADSKNQAKIFHRIYEARAAKCRTRKGARMLLEWLKSNKVKTIILSNHTIDGINFQLERLRIAGFISEVLASREKDTSLKVRNKLQKLKAYLSGKKYKPKEVLIVGDSPEEIEIGKKLGLITVAINDGYFSTRRLKESRPDYLITNISEMIKIVKAA